MGSTLLLATENEGKAREVRRFFEAVAIKVVTLAEYPEIEMPPETGETFEENARAKALFVHRALDGVGVLADDSGLSVDALGGRPGVHSARYAQGSDQDRFEKLLGELARVQEPDLRTARFVCAMAFVPPRANADPVVVEGTVEGWIGFEPKGSFGFGYDPIFMPLLDPQNRSMAELRPEEKEERSHRGQALRRIQPVVVRHFSLEF